jgi:hypothetical protein
MTLPALDSFIIFSKLTIPILAASAAKALQVNIAATIKTAATIMLFFIYASENKILSF